MNDNNIIPLSTYNTYNTYNTYTLLTYCVVSIIGLILIFGALVIHFNMYESKYIPVKAIVIDLECERFIINRERDEYHCKLTVEYKIDNNYLQTIVHTVGQNIYYIGSEILIYVDNDNPVEVYEPYISNNFISLASCFCGILLLLVTSGCLIIKV